MYCVKITLIICLTVMLEHIYSKIAFISEFPNWKNVLKMILKIFLIKRYNFFHVGINKISVHLVKLQYSHGKKKKCFITRIYLFFYILILFLIFLRQFCIFYNFNLLILLLDYYTCLLKYLFFKYVFKYTLQFKKL